MTQTHQHSVDGEGNLEVSAHTHGKDREGFPEPLLSRLPRASQLPKGRSWILAGGAHRHQAPELEQAGDLNDQIERPRWVDAALLRLAGHVHLHEHWLIGIGPG